MLSSLPPRERQIVDCLYERGPSLVADIREALPGNLSGSAVRAMLKRLEAKGFVQCRNSDRGHVYEAKVEKGAAKVSALQQIVRVFFNGSAAGAATALLGFSDQLDDSELDELERAIAKARRERE